MKVNFFDIKKSEIGKIDLPNQFDEEIRPDLIKRAVLTIQANKRKSYGSDPMAGKKASAELSRRRRDYRGSYGYGISRVPRKILSRRGRRMNWVGAFAPGTVGGRRAHPPKAEKIWGQKINKKERKKAIRSAISATIKVELVKGRGHTPPEGYPFVLENKIEDIKKTKELTAVLKNLGLKKELARTSEKKKIGGKGKSRGRKYKEKKGILIITSKECDLMKSASNIPGLDVENINKINAEILAPGGVPGRLTIFTQGAIDKLKKEDLFM